MLRYICKRILLLIPVLLGVIFIIFTIMELSPMDAVDVILGTDVTEEEADKLREELGLNRPFLVRYVDYIFSLLQGDMGPSYKNGQQLVLLSRCFNIHINGL